MSMEVGMFPSLSGSDINNYGCTAQGGPCTDTVVVDL